MNALLIELKVPFRWLWLYYYFVLYCRPRPTHYNVTTLWPLGLLHQEVLGFKSCVAWVAKKQTTKLICMFKTVVIEYNNIIIDFSVSL